MKVYTWLHDDGHHGGSDTNLVYEHASVDEAVADIAASGPYDEVRVFVRHPEEGEILMRAAALAAQNKARDERQRADAAENKRVCDNLFYLDMRYPR